MAFINDIINEGSLILDGALGTELHRRGVNIRLPLWSAASIRENPDIVQRIHEEYIHAGADIITTNTFRTDTRTYQKAGLPAKIAENDTHMAVNLVRQAISTASVQRKIWIAGSMAPLEDCYRPELAPDYPTAFAEHKQKAIWLAEAGVDFILIETMNTAGEALAAARAALTTGVPVAVSYILKDKDHIFNGDRILESYRNVRSAGIALFSVNCTHHSIITAFLDSYLDRIDLPVICYANAGFHDPEKGWQTDPQFTPAVYARIAERWFHRGVKIVGGCCGTGPACIQRIAEKKVQCDGESRWTGG
jgi:S-methylmethionine-dependent homocysteine/selenocysteine methylase